MDVVFSFKVNITVPITNQMISLPLIGGGSRITLESHCNGHSLTASKESHTVSYVFTSTSTSITWKYLKKKDFENDAVYTALADEEKWPTFDPAPTSPDCTRFKIKIFTDESKFNILATSKYNISTTGEVTFLLLSTYNVVATTGLSYWVEATEGDQSSTTKILFMRSTCGSETVSADKTTASVQIQANGTVIWTNPVSGLKDTFLPQFSSSKADCPIQEIAAYSDTAATTAWPT